MNNWNIRGLVFSALFAAIFLALSNVVIHLPFTTVPISLINFGTMLAGSILGARYGFLAVLLAVVLAAAGLPVIGGKGGLTLLLGPTAGFVWAAPFSALLIGWIAQRIQHGKLAYLQLLLTNFLLGSLFLYPSGVSWLAYKAHLPLAKALAVGMWPFLPGDFLKALVTAAVVIAVWRVYPMERIIGTESAK
jgi:biotin transport system substrate-specific component